MNGAEGCPDHQGRRARAARMTAAARHTAMEILRVEHLSKTYGRDESLVRALDDVSFSVNKGEFIAISDQDDIYPVSEKQIDERYAELFCQTVQES